MKQRQDSMESELNFKVDSFKSLGADAREQLEAGGDAGMSSFETDSTGSHGDDSNEIIGNLTFSNRASKFSCVDWLCCEVTTHLGVAFAYFIIALFEIFAMLAHFGPTWYSVLFSMIFFLVPVTATSVVGQGCYHICKKVCPTKLKPSWREAAKDGCMCAAAITLPVALTVALVCFFAASFFLFEDYEPGPGEPPAPLMPWADILSVQPGTPAVLPLSEFFQLSRNSKPCRILQFVSDTVLGSTCGAAYEYQDWLFMKGCICVAPLVLHETLDKGSCQSLHETRYWAFKQSVLWPSSDTCGQPSTCPSTCKRKHVNSTKDGCVAWFESPTFLLKYYKDMADKAVTKAVNSFNTTHNSSHIFIDWSEREAGWKRRKIKSYSLIGVPYVLLVILISFFPIASAKCFTKGCFAKCKRAPKNSERNSRTYYAANPYDDADVDYHEHVQDLYNMGGEGSRGSNTSNSDRTNSDNGHADSAGSYNSTKSQRRLRLNEEDEERVFKVTQNATKIGRA